MKSLLSHEASWLTLGQSLSLSFTHVSVLVMTNFYITLSSKEEGRDKMWKSKIKLHRKIRKIVLIQCAFQSNGAIRLSFLPYHCKVGLIRVVVTVASSFLKHLRPNFKLDPLLVETPQAVVLFTKHSLMFNECRVGAVGVEARQPLLTLALMPLCPLVQPSGSRVKHWAFF